MRKVQGHTQGLKPNQLKKLGNLNRRRFPPEELILPEQARDLAALSLELGRQVGVLVSRKGQVEQVLVGARDSLPRPDLRRLRRGRTRLAGYYLLRTCLGGGLHRGDLEALAALRLDLVAALGVMPDGRPELIRAAHLLPRPDDDGNDERLLEPFQPGRAPEDLSRLVRALEEELAFISEPLAVEGAEPALLVSVGQLSRAEAEARLDELGELAESGGLNVVGRVIQRLARPNPRTLLGRGKLNEVLLSALRLGAGVLVFDQELLPGQARSLAQSTESGLKFIDRTQLILDIFAQRARTREGKLQVEMAQLRYLTPRLGARDDGLSRLTGGIGGRGPGETRLEMDRRRVRQRLHRLGADLKQVAKQRHRRRKNRGALPIISIVGYTNAGKSTLLNALTGSKVLAENRLFATLDPTTRRLRFPREREVIITDTVGFIRDLPAELRKAFGATLEELHEADVLLHLADAGNPEVVAQIASVDAILDELEMDAPRVLVLNKMDLASPERLEYLQKRFNAQAVSALRPASLPPLLERLDSAISALGSGPFG